MSRRLLAALAGGLLGLVSASAASAQSTVVISQVYGGGGNSGATFTNDFIELYNYGPAPVPLDGWSVQYASAAGASWQRTNLTGTLQPGQYYLVQEAPGAGGTTPLPASDAGGAIPMSATAGKVALVSQQVSLTCGAVASDCFPNPAIVDFIGYGTATNFEGAGAAPGLSNTAAALRLGQGCTDTNNNAADFVTGAPTPRNTAVLNPGCAPPPPPVCVPDTTIAAVQGSGQASPVAGQTVSVAGIVTARITFGSGRGFFLQMAQGDGDPATSDGVFVFTGSTNPPADAAIGNEVCATGQVQEFVPAADPNSLPLTEIARPSVVTLIGSGNALPAPIVLTSADTPGNNAGAMERFEGMRVRVPSLTVVAPTDGGVSEPNASSTSNGLFFGVVTGVARPFREPGIDQFDVLAATAPATVPRFDTNPERIRVDSDQVGAPVIDVASGDTVTNLVGVVHYAFRTYSLFPDFDGTPVVTNTRAAVPVPALTARELTVASANLERFFDTVDDPNQDAVLTTTALERRLSKVSIAIRTVLRLPDILGVEEAENLAVLSALADRVNADAQAAGLPNPGYAAYLFEGNDIGGIDVGVLVKTSRVSVVDVQQVGKDTEWMSPDGDVELLNDRPPLVLTATVALPAGTFPVTVIVNHLRSLIDVEEAGATGARVRAKRAAQAEFLASYIQSRQQANPAERIVSVGDYNAFQFNDGYADVIGTVKGAPAPAAQVLAASPDLVNPNLTDAIEKLDASQRYSYVFDGNAQAIDHLLLNPPALATLTRVAVARVNADFPEVLRNDAMRPERYSDHDVPVAYFQLMPSDVSASVKTLATPLIFDPFRRVFLGAILIQNKTRQSIGGPIRLAFEGLPAGVTLTNADGDLLGVPYLNVLFTNNLPPGGIALAVVEFKRTGNQPITYNLKTLSGAF